MKKIRFSLTVFSAGVGLLWVGMASAQPGPPPGSTRSPLFQDHTSLAQQLLDLQAAVDALGFVFPGDGIDGPALSYQDNGDGTITDLNTGLQWEKKVAGSGCLHCVNDTYTFANATTTFIDAVNAESGTGFAGFNDWRLPNVRELQSIVDYGRFDPTIDPAFGPTDAFFTWSSTSRAGAPSLAWEVNFLVGFVVESNKGQFFSVRAVRGGR